MLTVIMTIENNDDRKKAEQLYKLYRSTMLYIAKSILHENSLAEDAVSEAFIRIIKNLDKIDEINCYKTRGFIVIIIRNVSIDLLRNRKRKKTVQLDESIEFENLKHEEPVFDELSTKEAVERITSCIDKLNSNYSDILYLKAFYDYSTDEISEILGITKENVAVRLSRARQALKEQLRKEEETNG